MDAAVDMLLPYVLQLGHPRNLKHSDQSASTNAAVEVTLA